VDQPGSSWALGYSYSDALAKSLLKPCCKLIFTEANSSTCSQDCFDELLRRRVMMLSYVMQYQNGRHKRYAVGTEYPYFAVASRSWFWVKHWNPAR
jgi:hypothetical protein